MPTVIYSPEAEDDLRNTAEFVAADDLVAAINLIDQLRASCDLLACQPFMGERVKTRRFRQVRRHVVGNYLVFYQPVTDGVYVLRVVHGAREQRGLF